MIEEKRCCTVCDAKKKCHVCKIQTLFACSDCQINLSATVYICGKAACRNSHVRVCSVINNNGPLTAKMLLQDMGFDDVWYDSNSNSIKGAPSWASEIAERILEVGWKK